LGCPVSPFPEREQVSSSTVSRKSKVVRASRDEPHLKLCKAAWQQCSGRSRNFSAWAELANRFSPKPVYKLPACFQFVPDISDGAFKRKRTHNNGLNGIPSFDQD
jgi:hypothetical protein